MTTFLYIILAIVVLLVLITVHEFGHYCAGKIFGFKINEFAIGFGPALYKKTKKDGEIFSIRALPLGGFCAFEGEDEEGKDEKGEPNPKAFNNMPGWKRLIVLLSGVTFNFLFGILTAAIYLMVTGYSTAMVTNTINKQGVATIGLKENDIILAIDGKSVEAYRRYNDLFNKYVSGNTDEIVFTVERDGKIIDVTTKNQEFPAFYYVSYDAELREHLFVKTGETYVKLTDSEYDLFVKKLLAVDVSSETGDSVGKGEGIKTFLADFYYKQGDNYVLCNDDVILNLLLNGNEENQTSSCIAYANANFSLGLIQTTTVQKYGFFESLLKAWPFCFFLCGLIFSTLGGLFTGATALKEMGGTITAVSQIAEISQMGIGYFLLLLPLLSMNLAVFNILPIPSLDGARSVFVLIEMARGKPINRNVEGWIHMVGLFVLLGLVVFFDVYHFFFAMKLLI